MWTYWRTLLNLARLSPYRTFRRPRLFWLAMPRLHRRRRAQIGHGDADGIFGVVFLRETVRVEQRRVAQSAVRVENLRALLDA